jgi:hypothetical protein
MDRELLAHFLRAGHGSPGRSQHVAGLVMTRVFERLSDCPAVVFSRFGEVMLQSRPAIALFGDYTGPSGSSRYLVDRWLTDPAVRERFVEVGVTRHHRRPRLYRHAELGGLELYRQLLLDPVDCQMLLVFTAVPGSASDEKLRLLAEHEARPTRRDEGPR